MKIDKRLIAALRECIVYCFLNLQKHIDKLYKYLYN